jgi:hypothetical protein
MDPDSDPDADTDPGSDSVFDLQNANKKQLKKKVFLIITF